jgi:fumarate reductase flavoprotein subunit
VDNDFDVIVVGGGGSGLSAAISAHDAGSSVMVLEADARLGGATMYAGGVLFAAGTSVQRSVGIEDTPDAMFDYIMCLNQWEMRPNLIRILCDQSAAGVEWLISLGAEFSPRKLCFGGVEEVPRAHPCEGAGGSIAEVLVNAAGSRGIECALKTRVSGLLVEDGRVVGVTTPDMELRSGAVVLTTGGFGNNSMMIKRHYPTAYSHGERTYAVHMHAKFIQGDGLRMAEQIGADVVGHDTGLLTPASGFARVIETEIPSWLVLVNAEGRRFMDETASYAVSGYIMNHQTLRRAFAVFDEETLVKASGDTSWSDPYDNGVPIPTWDEATVRKNIANETIRTANSIEELATRFAIDPIALCQTLKKYNEDCDRGIDSQFFKEATERFPIRKAPFYISELRASTIGLTGAGLNIDEQCQVLDQHSCPIPGLFAAGEVLGCVQGRRYAAGGMGLSNCVVFGRIAGTEAAKLSKSVGPGR